VEEERETFTEVAFQEGVNCQHDHQQEEQGHHHANGQAQSASDAGNDDTYRYRHKNAVPLDHLPLVGLQGLEAGDHLIAGGINEGSTAQFKDVVHRPAGNDTVVGENQHAGKQAQPTDENPRAVTTRLQNQIAHGVDRTASTATTHQGFSHHYRDANGGDAEQVYQYK